MEGLLELTDPCLVVLSVPLSIHVNRGWLVTGGQVYLRYGCSCRCVCGEVGEEAKLSTDFRAPEFEYMMVVVANAKRSQGAV